MLLISASTRVGRRDRGSGVIGRREPNLFALVVVFLHRRQRRVFVKVKAVTWVRGEAGVEVGAEGGC